MPSLSRRDFVLLAALASAGTGRAMQIGGGGWSVRGTDPVEIFHLGKAIASYHSGFAEGRPFLEPIAAADGGLFTARRDGGDGGIAFALGSVNGYDCRTVPGGAGTQTGRILHKGMNGVLIKGPVLTLRLKSDWQDAHEVTRRICSDRRELSFFFGADESLVVDFDLELIADAGDLALGVQDGPAFSLHPSPALAWSEKAPDRSLRNSEGLAEAKVPGSRAAWVACQGGDEPGEAAGIAILDHPANPGHPAQWTIDGDGRIGANPFPAEGEPPPPVAYGKSIRFRYRAIFFRGGIDGLDLPKAFASYAAR